MLSTYMLTASDANWFTCLHIAPYVLHLIPKEAIASLGSAQECRNVSAPWPD